MTDRQKKVLGVHSASQDDALNGVLETKAEETDSSELDKNETTEKPKYRKARRLPIKRKKRVKP